VLFFAISGVLICSRILEEEAMTGRFHLKRFYIRRLFRIQPAAWVYLAVIGGLTLAGVLHEHWKYWFGALFLYENFLYRETVQVTLDGFFTGHFWTLAVEEHFYLLISLAFFFIRRRRIVVFAAALVMVKTAQEIGAHYTADPLLRRTYWQIHVLLWPSLAALLLREPRVRAAAVRWLEPRWVFLATAVLGAAAWTHSRAALPNLLGWMFTFWIVATMLHPQSWATRVLELPPLRFVGRISYSLYLWHVLFYSKISPPPIDSRLLLFLSERPWKYVCAVAVAVMSYYFIEKPFIRLGHRIAPPATAGHRDLGG
jgi:peptidoglycan/LPS O-acetylase OafA/YrhL